MTAESEPKPAAIHQESEESRGRFYIGAPAQADAEMTYSRAGERLVIVDHTFVAPDQRGQGLGQLLLRALVEWARAEQIKVIPLCPFARAQLAREPAFGDVLA